jgi:uncharacterized protein (TIGR00299 family) protein
MRTLAFDGRMGASGDMLLGALLAAGCTPATLAPVRQALPVELSVDAVTKNGIEATTVAVLLSDSASPADEGGGSGNEQTHDGDAGHSHDDSEDHAHSHAHSHASDSATAKAGPDSTPAEAHGPTRTYEEVIERVEAMALPATVEADAKAVFERLGEAEASIHGTDLSETHFHEVGADDAIADVVGVCLLLDELAPDRVVTTPLSVGGGDLRMGHGRYPVPAPAVVEIAQGADWSIRGGPVEAELLTPTGAALLAHFAEGVESLPELSITASGYGAGDAEFREHPNVLRALVGERTVAVGSLEPDRESRSASASALGDGAVTVLETNVDDVTPEVLGSLQRSLAEAGALDVTVLPATMKKARPGNLVIVVTKPDDITAVRRRLAAETGTLGVRERGSGRRWEADRTFVTATLLEAGSRYPVAVKLGFDDGAVFDVSAEFDDASSIAAEIDEPVRAVRRRAERAARDGGATDDSLLHIVGGGRWREFEAAEAYTHPSLEDTGFVHLSPAHRVVGVAQYNHADETDPRLLVIDPDAVTAEIRYEEMPSGAFPHCYGPIDADAIVDVLDFPRTEDGRYTLPRELE